MFKGLTSFEGYRVAGAAEVDLRTLASYLSGARRTTAPTRKAINAALRAIGRADAIPSHDMGDSAGAQ